MVGMVFLGVFYLTRVIDRSARCSSLKQHLEQGPLLPASSSLFAVGLRNGETHAQGVRDEFWSPDCA